MLLAHLRDIGRLSEFNAIGKTWDEAMLPYIDGGGTRYKNNRWLNLSQVGKEAGNTGLRLFVMREGQATGVSMKLLKHDDSNCPFF